MYVTEGDRQRLSLIDQLLREQRYEELERVVGELFAHGLLNTALLDAARALNLAPTVILLATLGVENLPAPGDCATWLETYRSLGRKAETEGFRNLPQALPIKWVARNLMAEGAPETRSLGRCKGKPRAWVSAFELAVDQRRFDLVEHLTAHRLAQKAPVEEWLLVVRMLMERRPLLETCRDTAPLARSIARIRKGLPAVPATAVARSALAAHAAQYFLQSGEYAQAIVAGGLATAPSHRWLQAVTLAEAHCHAGDLPRSIEWADAALSVAGLAHQQEEFRQARETAELRKQFNPPFDPVAAARALVALQETLEPRGHKAFLVSGTLLGYAREGQLLAHDKDIDVGVVEWESQFDVVQALLESGRFAVDTRTLRGEQTYHIPTKHLPTNTDIDVFIYHQDGGTLVTGVQSKFGYLQKFAFSPFRLRSVDFLGIRIDVPDDVDRNLSENFGNWRVPDPDYISHLESPSTTDVGGLVYQLVGRLTCLSAVRQAKPERLRRALHLLDRHRDQACGMGPALIEDLRKLSRALDGDRSEPAPLQKETMPC